MTKPVGNSQDLYFAAEQPVTHEDESLVSLIDDLKYKIFCFLEPAQLLSICLTCKDLSKAFQDDKLWQVLFVDRFSNALRPGSVRHGSFLEAYQSQHVWHRVKSNLKQGFFASHTLDESLVTHSTVIANDKLIALSNEDSTISVWDSNTMTYMPGLLRRAGCDGRLFSFFAAQGMLFGGTREGWLEVWDVKTMKFLGGYPGLHATIACMASAGNKLFTASRHNNVVGIWDLEVLRQDRTWKQDEVTYVTALPLEGKGGIKSLLIEEDMLIASFDDGNIEFRDAVSMECIEIKLIPNGRIPIALAAGNGNLFLSYNDGRVEMWSLKSRECLDVVTSGYGVINSLVFTHDVLISSSNSGAVRIWDVENKTKDPITNDMESRLLESSGVMSLLTLSFGMNKLTISSNHQKHPGFKVLDFDACSVDRSSI